LEPIERRLAAILAADIAGYSRLIGADDEATLARLKALRRELVDVAVAAGSRIEFRVGIHQRDIVVEDGDIFGDGVNIAARLEGLAEPGGIGVSARVQEDATGKLDLAFEDVGEQSLGRCGSTGSVR
jgi:adenylate cyclase